jgi:hypothetical protein
LRKILGANHHIYTPVLKEVNKKSAPNDPSKVYLFKELESHDGVPCT